MTWNLIAVVDDDHDDPALYPVTVEVDSRLAVAPDTLDGATTSWIVADAVRVFPTPVADSTELLRLPPDIKWSVGITDSRVILFCAQYDKGGGWVGFGAGGLLVAVTANAVSKARAKRRSRGKALVGHIRYPWISMVIATPKVSWLTSERLRFRVNAPNAGGNDRFLVIELELPKHGRALDVAHEIARRAAAYRLAHDSTVAAEEQRALTELMSTARREPATPSSTKKPTWAQYVMPSFYRVNPATAYPRPQQADSARAE